MPPISEHDTTTTTSNNNNNNNNNNNSNRNRNKARTKTRMAPYEKRPSQVAARSNDGASQRVSANSKTTSSNTNSNTSTLLPINNISSSSRAALQRARGPDAPSSDETLRDSSPVGDTGRHQPSKRLNLFVEDLVTKSGRTKREESENSDFKRIRQLAQSIKRNVDLWVNVPHAMNVGKAAELLGAYGRLNPSDAAYDTEEKELAEDIVSRSGSQRDLLVKVYKGVIALFHEQKDLIDSLTDRQEKSLWNMIHRKANQGRNNDTNTIKQVVGRIVLKTGRPDPPIDGRGGKMKLGTAHAQLLRMIVPMSILHKNGGDPNFDALVQTGKFKIDHSSFPAFMFDVESYTPRRSTASLLRGHYPIRVLNAIWNSPTAATGEKTRSTHRTNAKILGIRVVTPEMIAYACVHARFAISKQVNWGEVDGLFNMKKFYYSVLKLFDKREVKWVKETLEWWTRQVFGDQEDARIVEDDTADPEDETSVANILAEIEAGDSSTGEGETFSDEEDRQIILGEDEPVRMDEDGESEAPEDALSQTQEDTQYEDRAFDDLYADT